MERRGDPAIINYCQEKEEEEEEEGEGGEVRFERVLGVVPAPGRYQSVSITQQQEKLLRFKLRENIQRNLELFPTLILQGLGFDRF